MATSPGYPTTYLTHPLSLVGFVLPLFFGIHRTLIKSGIIPPLEVGAGGPIVHSLLRYGLVIAPLIILPGFGLELYKTPRDVQILNDQAAAALGMDKSNVSKAIKLLIEKGVLIRGPKIGHSNSFRLNPNYGWKGKVKYVRRNQKTGNLEIVGGTDFRDPNTDAI